MCPKISRRSAPGFHHKQGKKAQIFPALRARNPANRPKRPEIFRRYAPEDPPPDCPTHIKYVSTAAFCSLVSIYLSSYMERTRVFIYIFGRTCFGSFRGIKHGPVLASNTRDTSNI